MAFKDLPPKYYLTHFFELIDFLEEKYLFLFEERHAKFLSDFRSLSEDAQCVYVRMVNRKGVVFHSEGFHKYKEIDDPMASLMELRDLGFIGGAGESHLSEIFSFLTKSELRKWLANCGIKTPVSLSREDLIEVAETQAAQLTLDALQDADALVIQGRAEDLDYLLFLFFGQIQKSLNLYTLRDLGIRRTNSRSEFRPRFRTLDEARMEFLLNQKIENPGTPLELFEFLFGIDPQKTSSRKLKDQLLLEIASAAEDDLAIKALKESKSHPAREKLVRLLYKLDRKDEAKEILEQIIQEPWSDQELLFAEDFLARKFDKKRLGYLTEILRSAQEVTLSEFYFRRPEHGVKDLYRSQGKETHFTENYLWTSLFGLLFWEELFEGETAAVFNQFERSSQDLVGEDFYAQNQEAIEKKLSLFQNPKALDFYFLKVITENYGKLNDVFQWHPTLSKRTLNFLSNSREQNVAHVLRTMAQKFEYHHSGFPDLMIMENGRTSFIEVKAEGDALRSKQLSQIRLLREAGFDVEVLRVKWQADPEQTYVVLDVETTGGTSSSHRVTEVGAVKVRNGKIIDEFSTLINPGRPIPRYITQLTGISDDMVADAPTFEEIAEALYEFTDKAIFVAHNVRFDYGFIQREFQRAGMEFVRPTMCTVVGSRRAFPGLPSYSLKNLSEHFGIALEQHHRALHDAKASAALLIMMNDRSPPQEV